MSRSGVLVLFQRRSTPDLAAALFRTSALVIRSGAGGARTPRPADYENYGTMHHKHYLHGYHEVVPLVALIALAARVTRSTNRSTVARSYLLSCYCA